MKRTILFGILVGPLITTGPNGQLTAQAVSPLTGPAVLDDWGNRFFTMRMVKRSAPENHYLSHEGS